MSTDSYDDFFRAEAQVPAPGDGVGGLFEEESQGPWTDEAEKEEIESEHCGSTEEDADLLASGCCFGVDCGWGCVAEEGLEERPVGGYGVVETPGEEEGDEGVEGDGDEEDGFFVGGAVSVDVC